MTSQVFGTNNTGLSGTTNSFGLPSTYGYQGSTNPSLSPQSSFNPYNSRQPTQPAWISVTDTTQGDRNGVTSQTQTSNLINNLTDVFQPMDPRTGKRFDSTATPTPSRAKRAWNWLRGNSTSAPTDQQRMDEFRSLPTTTGQAMDAMNEALRAQGKLHLVGGYRVRADGLLQR